MRTILSVLVLTAALAPAAAHAGGQCEPFTYEREVGPFTVTLVDVAC